MRFAGSAGLLALAVVACAGDQPGASAADDLEAPGWLASIDGLGTWLPEQPSEDYELRRGWVDARIANVRYHKRVLIETLAPYGQGRFIRNLTPARYKATEADGYERWGSDAIEIHPDGGPNDAVLAGPVMARLRVQHDSDGDGSDEMVATPWRVLFGEGDVVLPNEDPWALDLSSPGSNGEAPDGNTLTVRFSPFEDPGAEIVDRIDALIAAKEADPETRVTLHAAVFNMNDAEIIDRVIDAHRAGVEVRLVMDGRKHRPRYRWYFGDDRLTEAGVPLMGVTYPGTGAMHDKITLFDGKAVATGSMNWEWGARFENDENMVFSDRRDLVAAYARRFEALAGGPLRARRFAADSSAEVSLSFAPDEEPHRVVGRLIDGAETQVLVAMFTAKDVAYTENGRPTSLLSKLVAAQRRGVDVRVIIDHGIHEASEYYGIVTEDDPIDEWLEEQGVHVVRADNTLGRYASMHHKMVVIDDEVAVTGAFNWYYDAAFVNDEDQLVIRDRKVATRFRGEITDLLRRYDPSWNPDEWPQVRVQIEAHNDGTAWGDQVRLIGDHPSLGAWVPKASLALDAVSWPAWSGELTLPAGIRLSAKLIVVDRHGRIHWEAGQDRRLVVPTDRAEAVITPRWR